MTDIHRIMPDRFAGFSKDDALRQLAEEQKADAERLRKEAERAAAEKKRLEDLARGNAEKGNVVVPAGDVDFSNVVFGRESTKDLNLPDAVRFAGKFGILQSLDEAVYARKNIPDQRSHKFNDGKQWKYQHTRLGAFYVVENGKAYVAFDDVADSTRNAVIHYAVDGCQAHKEGKGFFIDGSWLDDILNRAKGSNRFLEVPVSGNVEESVVGSPCEYETNPYFVAVLGKEMACVNAELIRSKNFDTGKLFMPNALIVRSAVSSGKGLVRPVGLGFGSYLDISNVNANYNFNLNGRARGVRYVPDDTQ
jgi:hypothetical protein